MVELDDEELHGLLGSVYGPPEPAVLEIFRGISEAHLLALLSNHGAGWPSLCMY